MTPLAIKVRRVVYENESKCNSQVLGFPQRRLTVLDVIALNTYITHLPGLRLSYLGPSVPPLVTNANIALSESPPISKTLAVYTCNPGYVLAGGDTVVCRNDGTWSHPPACVKGET